MSIAHGLVEFLRSSAPIDAMIQGRVHPIRLPAEPAFPAIVYQVITNPRDYDHDGPSGYATPRIQLSMWAEKEADFPSALELAARVQRRLSGYAGELGAGAGKVGGVFLLTEQHDVEADTGYVRVRQDWRFGHREVV